MTRMRTLPTRQEIAFQAAQDPGDYFATRLISQVQRELQRANRRHWMITSRWLIAFEYLKTLEERIVTQETPRQKERAFFDATVAVMLGLGRRLLHQLATADNVPLDSLGLTYEDLAACVAELEDIERASHREWAPGQLDKLHAAPGTPAE